MATGAAGYQRLQKVGNYISDNANRAADRAAANMRQARALNAQKKARQEKRLDDALKEADVDTEALQAKVTGFANRDDVARDYARQAAERSMEYAELAREAASNSDWKTHRMYLDKMNRIKGDFKNAVNDEKFLGETFAGYFKGFQEGKIDDEDWLDFMAAVEDSDYEISLDENDNRVITALVKGEDGEMKKVSKKMADLVNGNERPYEVVPVNGKGGLVDQMLVGFGKRKYDSTGANYVTTEQVWDDKNETAFNVKVQGLQSDDRTMYSLLKQASNGQIRKKEGFNEEDKQIVRDFLYKQVRGQYDEVSSQKVRQMTPEEKKQEAAANRAVTRRGQNLAQSRHKDNMALKWYNATKPDGEGDLTDEEMKMSRLHQDALDFSANSKPQVLNGTTITRDKKEYTVYDVLEPKGANYVTVYMKDSKDRIVKENVPKTKRGFLDFKLRSPQYKKYTADKVLDQKPIEYQEITPQQASQVQAIFDSTYKDEDGKFNGDDDAFVADLREMYGLSAADVDDVVSFLNFNVIKVGKAEIDLDDDDAMLQVDRAIRQVKGEEVSYTPSTATASGGFDPNNFEVKQ